MKTSIKIITLFSFILFIASCSTTDPSFLSSSGTVKYISLEGGFYGIVTDDNESLDPINLPKEFQVDGKKISFMYKVRNDLASFHMWGVLIEITEIHELK